jgi:hypothetical protein
MPKNLPCAPAEMRVGELPEARKRNVYYVFKNSSGFRCQRVAHAKPVNHVRRRVVVKYPSIWRVQPPLCRLV